MAKCPKCNNRFSVFGSNIRRIESLSERRTFIMCPNCLCVLKEVLNNGFKIALYSAIVALIAAFILFTLQNDVSLEKFVYSPIILFMFILWLASPFFTKYEVIENLENKEKSKQLLNAEKPWYRDRMILYLCRRIVLIVLLVWFLLEDGQEFGWFHLNSFDHALGLAAILICSLISAIVLIYPII